MKSYLRILKERLGTSLWPKIANKRLRPFVFLGVLAIPLPAAAIAVKPTYQVFQVKSGKSTEGEMTVTNDTPDPITYKPFVKEWYQLKANKDFKVDSWMKIDNTPLVLKPGESKQFKFKLVAPKKATGELCGAITFSNKPPGATITMLMSVVQYLAIEGTEKISAKVPGIALKLSSDTVVAVMVQNEGNVHLRPKGWVYIDKENGERIMNVELEAGQPVFPGDQRVYQGTVKGFRLPEGTYSARIELEDIDRTYTIPVINKKFILTPDGKVQVK